MKVKAIVYSSHAGHTEAYAQMLSAELGVPVFPLGSCTAPKGSEIVYLGWLRAGKAVGLKKHVNDIMSKWSASLACPPTTKEGFPR